MSLRSEMRCMNQQTTRVPFTIAMARARAMAALCGRCMYDAPTVMPVRRMRHPNTMSAARTWCSMSGWSWTAAGAVTASAWASLTGPSLEKVEHGEEEDPDQVDEMPEQAGVLHPVR